MPRKTSHRRRRRIPEREHVRRINGKEYVRMNEPHYTKQSAENRAAFFRARDLWAQVKEGKRKGKHVYYVYIYAPGPTDLHKTRTR